MPTICDMVDPRILAWLEWGRRTRRWADSTCSTYAMRVRWWLDWLARGDVAPEDATPDHVRAWLDTLSPSPSVRAGALTALVALYDFGTAKEHNPARAVERVPVRRSIPRSLERDAVTRVLDAAATYGPRWACFMGLYAYAGLRRAETCHRRWVDVEGGGRWLRVLGKGGVERIVPIHERLRVLINAWHQVGAHPVWIFPGRDPSRPMGLSTANKWVRRILDDAGVREATGHWLRHSYATRILERTGDIAATKEALGHATLSATTIYTRARPAKVAEAVASLDY